MKSFVKSILFLSVTILYVVSTMGFGVHRCTMDGTASVILLFGNTPCAYAHSHGDEGYHLHSCQEHSCQEHHGEAHNGEEHHQEKHHGDDCCSTDVYVVSHDQTLADDNNITPVPFSFDMAIVHYNSHIEVSSGVAGCKEFIGSAGGAFHKSHSQAAFCLFRV